MKIVFFGTSAFSVTILEHLLHSPYQVIAVVTKPDKPQGRALKLTPPPVKEWLLANAPAIPLYQPLKASSDDFVALMKTLTPDVFVVASYGEIMKTSLLNVPRLGPINVHPSLLPKWRGAAPIRRPLMAGETQTGVTIMKMVRELDAGDMLAVKTVPIPPEMTHGELEHLLAAETKDPLLEVLAQLEKGTALSTPQDPSQVTFASKITPEDCVIDWTQSAAHIHNQIRALSPMPGAWTSVLVGGEPKKLKIKLSKVIQGNSLNPKQNVVFGPKEWIVACGQDSLSLLELQLEGKKTVSTADFLRGCREPLLIR